MTFFLEWRAVMWRYSTAVSRTSTSSTSTRAVSSPSSSPTAASGSSALARTTSWMPGGLHTEPAYSRSVIQIMDKPSPFFKPPPPFCLSQSCLCNVSTPHFLFSLFWYLCSVLLWKFSFLNIYLIVYFPL